MRLGEKINRNQYKIRIKKENDSKNDLILKENNISPIENNILNNMKFNINQKKLDRKNDFN